MMQDLLLYLMPIALGVVSSTAAYGPNAKEFLVFISAFSADDEGAIHAYQLQPDTGQDFFHGVAEGDGVQYQAGREVVWLGREHESAGPRDPRHLRDDGAGVGDVDQQRLARDEIEAGVGKRQRLCV